MNKVYIVKAVDNDLVEYIDGVYDSHDKACEHIDQLDEDSKQCFHFFVAEWECK